MNENRFIGKDGADYVAKDANIICGESVCTGCTFYGVGTCPVVDGGPSCVGVKRQDGREVIWVRSDATHATDPTASDLAPREALLAHIADLEAQLQALRTVAIF